VATTAGIKDRSAERAAYLLADPARDRMVTYGAIRDAYDRRSATVHGRMVEVEMD
jgi:hypothetical protein